jgi:uncharacterized membrane protein YgcG
MGRNLVALFMLGFAFWRSDLLHPKPFYALWLPLIGLAAFLYLMLRMLRPSRGGGGSDSSGGDGGGCDSDGGGCGGDGGGGGD